MQYKGYIYNCTNKKKIYNKADLFFKALEVFGIKKKFKSGLLLR